LNGASSVAERRFDLLEVQSGAWLNGRDRNRFYLGIAGLLILSLYFIVFYVGRFRSQGLTELSLLSLIPGAAGEALLVWLILWSRKGPGSLRIASTAVELIFSSGRLRVYDFADRKCKLVIRGGNPELGPLQWRIVGGSPYRCYISDSAVSSIIEVCRAHGRPIEERMSMGERAITIRAGPRS